MKIRLTVIIIFCGFKLLSQDKKNILRFGIDVQAEIKIPKSENIQFGPQLGLGPMLTYIRKLKPRTNIAIGTRYYYYFKPKNFEIIDNGSLKNYSEKHSIWYNYLGGAQNIFELKNSKSIWLGVRIGTGTKFMRWTSPYADLNRKFNTTELAWGVDGSYHYNKFSEFGISYLKIGKADFLLFMLVYDIPF